MMDLVITLGAFLMLAILAPRYGWDSRDLPRSREEILAGWGFRRDDHL